MSWKNVIRAATLAVAVVAVCGAFMIHGSGVPRPPSAHVARYEGRLVETICCYTSSAYIDRSGSEKEALRSSILGQPDIVSIAGTYLLQRREVTDTAFEVPVRCDVAWELRNPGEERYLTLADKRLSFLGSESNRDDELRSYIDYMARDGGMGERTFCTQRGNDVRVFTHPLAWPVDDEREWKRPVPYVIASSGLEARTLNRVFASGECALVVRNGERILAHALYNPNGIAFCEVYFDEQRRVRRVDVVNRPPYPEAEIRKYYSEDLFDLKITLWSVHFREYTEVNGVMFPRVVEEYRYRGFESEHTERVKRGEMSEVDARVRDCLARATPVVSWARRAEFDLATLRVNEPLARKDFVLPLPSGTVVETQTGSQYLIGTPGESMAELQKKAEAKGFQTDFFSNLPAFVPRLRLHSMHIPDESPMLLLKYSSPTPIGELIRPVPAPQPVAARTNWTVVASLMCAVSGLLALAALLIIKWRRW